MYCLIESASSEINKECARIVWQCALDSRVALDIKPAINMRLKEDELFLTLRLSPEEALKESASWCLACRLTCFCPNARVSILISASKCFQLGVEKPRNLA